MIDAQYHKNPAPEYIDSIDRLLEEGKSRMQTTLMVGHVFGPAFPPAEAYYERALQIGIPDPRQEYEARFSLGTLLAAEWKREEATPHIERAVALRPQDPRSRNVLGRLYENSGRFAEASKEFLEAARLSWSPRSLYRGLLNYVRGL